MFQMDESEVDDLLAVSYVGSSVSLNISFTNLLFIRNTKSIRVTWTGGYSRFLLESNYEQRAVSSQ